MCPPRRWLGLVGTVLFSALGANLDSRLQDLPADQRDRIVTAVTDSAGATIPALRAHEATAHIGRITAESFTTASSYAAFAAAGFLAIALAASTTLTSRREPETPVSETQPAVAE